MSEATKKCQLNEASVYAHELRQYCIKQSDCLSCSFHGVEGCRIGQPIGWSLVQEQQLDTWHTSLFEDGWKEGFGIGKQELAHAVMKLFEEKGV